MSDDFILKWDDDSEQLVGEDENGNRIAVPIEAVKIDTSATVGGDQVAIDGDEQPPESHDNTAHTETYALQSDVDDNSSDISSNSSDISNLESNKLDASNRYTDSEAQSAVSNQHVGVTSSSVSGGYEITIDGDTYTFIEE